MDTRLRIGELAAQVGMSTNAIRFYERVGLLDPPHRAPNGYRIYDEAAVGQLQFIRRAKVLGLSLEEIKFLFETAKSGRSALLREQVVQLLDEKLQDVKRQMQELTSLDASLRKRRQLAVITTMAPPCKCLGFDMHCACLPVAPEEVAAPS